MRGIEELAAAYANARLELIEGAAHGFETIDGEKTEEAKKTTCDYTLKFLRENAIL